jgi:hypothetical protein
MDTELFLFAKHNKPPAIRDILTELAARDLPVAWTPTRIPTEEEGFDWSRGMLLSIPDGSAQISITVEPAGSLREDFIHAYGGASDDSAVDSVRTSTLQYRIVVDLDGDEFGERTAANLVDMLLPDADDAVSQVGTNTIELSDAFRRRRASLLSRAG